MCQKIVCLILIFRLLQLLPLEPFERKCRHMSPTKVEKGSIIFIRFYLDYSFPFSEIHNYRG